MSPFNRERAARVNMLLGFRALATSLDTSGAILHIWSFDTSVEPDPSPLGAEERQRAARFYFQPDRTRYIASHVRLRGILSGYLNCPADQIRFESGPMGKPFVEAAASSLAFNLSHSGQRALVAVSDGAELGIDVEQIRDGRSVTGVARRFFTDGENRWLESLDADQQLRGFYRLWTLKEACLKAAGTGLSIPPNRFEISIGREGPRIFSSEKALEGPWDLRELITEQGYCAAVAVRGAIGRIEHR